MAKNKTVRVDKCPIGHEYCYPSCYWRKDNRCYFKSKRSRKIPELKKEGDMSYIGSLMKQYQTARLLSLRVLAAISGISTSHLCRIDKVSVFRDGQLFKMAQLERRL